MAIGRTNYTADAVAAARSVLLELTHLLGQYRDDIVAEKFASPNHVGPKFVADFEELTDPDARALVQRDAYERVQYLLQGLGIA